MSRSRVLVSLTVASLLAPAGCHRDKPSSDSSPDEDNHDSVEVCGDITVATTWDDPEGYYVSCDLSVMAALTIEPGAHVYFAADTRMGVGVEGEAALIVNASVDPVRFESGYTLVAPEVEAEAGDWTGLVFGPWTDPDLTVLDGLEVYHAGGDGADGAVVMDGVDLTYTNGAVCLSGGDGLVALNGAEPTVAGTTLCENLGRGLYADDGSGLEGFSGNTLAGNQDYPISVPFSYGGAIDASNVYEDHDTTSAFVELRGDTVTSSVTLEGQGYPFYVPGDVLVAGGEAPRLTLEDGVSMIFASDAGLQVGDSTSPGDLTVNGSSEGVEMTARDATLGWEGVTVERRASAIQIYGLELSYGGSNGYADLYLVGGTGGLAVTIEASEFTYSFQHGLYVGDAVLPAISGSTFAHNAGYGLYIYDSVPSEGGLYVGSGASFMSNTLTDNAAPIQVPAAYVDQLDASCSFVGNDTDLIMVTGSTVDRSGTWQRLDVDYSVLEDVTIEGTDSPMLSIDAGTTLLLAEGVAFEVGDSLSGGMVTTGTASSPVLFTSAPEAPAPGDWDGLLLAKNTLSSTTLAGLVVEYAGGNGKGGVYVRGSDPVLESCRISNNANNGVYVEGSATDTPKPSFSGCTFEDNEDDGLYVDSNSCLSAFSGNTFSGNGGYPVSVNVDCAGALDTASTYASSSAVGYEMVRVLGSTLSDDSTWRHLDVPWFIPTDITISADLDVSSGSTVLFDGGASFEVGELSAGSLTATGTSSSHITFTSASEDPASGDWDGISLKSGCDPSSFTYVDVSYGSYGLYLDCGDGISIEDSTFAESATYDLYCSSRASHVTLSSVSYETQLGCAEP